MPRELMHWEVLLRAGERAEASGATIVADLLREYRDLALIGAVAHDAPYYFQAGGTSFERVANGLHGFAGQDTFHPLRLMANDIAAKSDIELRRRRWGFLLGMMSHAIADQWMHPWVFYFSGDYYHPDPVQQIEARRRHRLLEVYLDSWVSILPDRRAPNRSLLSMMRAQRGLAIDSVTTMLGETLTRSLFFPEEVKRNTAQEWHQALWHQAILQLTFTNPISGLLLDLAGRFGTPKIRSIEALSSYQRRAIGAELGIRYQYLNPATGEERSTSMQELLDGAADECARLFTALDSEIDSSAPPAILRLYRGVSLNYGAWGVGPGDAKYYSADGLPLPGLSMK